MIFEQGMRITPFIRPWSTMTINESCPFEGGEVGDKVNRELFEWQRGGRGNGGKWRTSGVMVDFVLLTYGASRYEGIDK